MAGQVTLSGNSFGERLESLYKIGLYSDLNIIVIDPETRATRMFRTHKAILALTGPVWETAIRWAKDDKIVVDNFSIDIMECVIDFAYTGKAAIRSIGFCMSVIRTADYYSMSSLTSKCVDYVENYISNDKLTVLEFIELFNMASDYNIRRLITACLGFIEDNPSDVLNSREFVRLNRGCVDVMIAVEKYLCPEFSRALALIEWARKNSGNRPLLSFISDLDFVKTIRFSIMKKNETEGLLENHRDIFTDEDIHKISSSLLYKKPKIDMSPSSLESELNIEEPDKVIVGQPPMEITEQFSYIGTTISIPFFGFILQPKVNSYVPTYNEDYEESLSIECGKEFCEYNEKTNRKIGSVCKFSQHFSVRFQAVNYIIVRITLKSCGVYIKDSFSPSPRYHGLLHSKKGLIKEIIHK